MMKVGTTVFCAFYGWGGTVKLVTEDIVEVLWTRTETRHGFTKANAEQDLTVFNNEQNA